jgi:hypothetical protein
MKNGPVHWAACGIDRDGGANGNAVHAARVANHAFWRWCPQVCTPKGSDHRWHPLQDRPCLVLVLVLVLVLACRVLSPLLLSEKRRQTRRPGLVWSGLVWPRAKRLAWQAECWGSVWGGGLIKKNERHRHLDENINQSPSLSLTLTPKPNITRTLTLPNLYEYEYKTIPPSPETCVCVHSCKK